MPDSGQNQDKKNSHWAEDSGFERTIFEPEHEMFRDSVRRFIAEEITPYYADWEEAGETPREVWLKAGAAGMLGTSIPEAYGGVEGGFLYDAVVLEELGRAGAAAPAFDLHSYIVAPFLQKFGTEEQKQRWLPGMASGEIIASIGMTEPDSGSDLTWMRPPMRCARSRMMASPT